MIWFAVGWGAMGALTSYLAWRDYWKYGAEMTPDDWLLLLALGLVWPYPLAMHLTAIVADKLRRRAEDR